MTIRTCIGLVWLDGWMDDGWTDEWDNTMIPGYMHVRKQKQILYIRNTRRWTSKYKGNASMTEECELKLKECDFSLSNLGNNLKTLPTL